MRLPEYEAEGGEDEVDAEGVELPEEARLDEGLPLGLQQVHHHALDQVQVLDQLLQHL